MAENGLRVVVRGLLRRARKNVIPSDHILILCALRMISPCSSMNNGFLTSKTLLFSTSIIP